jgi:Zn-dependent protease
MADQVLLYLGAALTALWGVAHLFPTASIVRGFGDISIGNKRVITMEWIIGGVALIFIGLLVALVTAIDFRSPIAIAVYILSAGCPIVLAIVSLFTGFKVNFLPYKFCPVVFTVSALLILAGGIM